MKWDVEANGPQRRIVSAAMRHKDTGLIVCGVRHFDALMHGQIRAAGLATPGANQYWDQGFVDNRYEFVTREEAMKIAVAAGQTEKRGTTALYSEDLY